MKYINFKFNIDVIIDMKKETAYSRSFFFHITRSCMRVKNAEIWLRQTLNFLTKLTIDQLKS